MEIKEIPLWLILAVLCLFAAVAIIGYKIGLNAGADVGYQVCLTNLNATLTG